jgi:hypothetical protein
MLASPVMAVDEIVVYSARNERLIKPLMAFGLVGGAFTLMLVLVASAL